MNNRASSQLQKLWGQIPVLRFIALLVVSGLEYTFLKQAMLITSKATATPIKSSVTLPSISFWPSFDPLLQLILFPILLIFVLTIVRLWQMQEEAFGDVSLVASLIRVVKSEIGGTFYGFLLLLFLVTNISWTQNLLFDFIKGTGSVYLPMMTALFAPIPFLFPLTRQINETISPTCRKVMITSLSIPQTYGTPEYNPNSVKSDPKFPGWLLSWHPIRKCLNHYPNISCIYIIQSNEAREFLRDLPIGSGLEPIGELLKKTFSHRNLQINFIDAPDANDFKLAYPEIKKSVEIRLANGKHSDEEVIFGLTGGTTPQTLALAFTAMKGKRGCAYNRQDMFNEENVEKAIVELPVDVFSIKELWQEILQHSTPNLS